MEITSDEELMCVFELLAKDYINLTIKEDNHLEDEIFRDESVFVELTTNPQHKHYLEVFCFNFFVRKEYQKIKILLKQALKHQPDCLQFQFNLALAYYLSDDINQALTIARTIDIKQYLKQLDLTLNFIKHQEIDFEDENELEVEKAGSMDDSQSIGESKKIFVRNLLAQIQQLRETDNYTEAINKYHTLLSVTGKAPCLLLELGQLYFWTEQHKEAKKYLNKALAGNPGLYHAYRTLIAVHRKLNEYELAVGVLKKAVKAFPTDDLLYLELATGYQVLGHTNKAVDALKTALELDPTLHSCNIFDDTLQAVFDQLNQ